MTMRAWMLCVVLLAGPAVAWADDAADLEDTVAQVGVEAASAADPAVAATASSSAAAPEAAPGADSSGAAQESADPYESFNRKVFLFNGVVDHFLIKPVAEVYETVVPRPLRLGVGNFVGNIGDAWSVVNLMLQGKPAKALEMGLRVGVNTVFGLAGLIDLATEAGLERQSEDFGQTLAAWGVPSGAYLVVPIFGPSTLRDAAAMPLDRAAVGLARPSGEAQRWRWVGLQLTHGRAEVLPFTRMLDTVALDKYTFVRDAYLARRRSQVYDGSPPDSPSN